MLNNNEWKTLAPLLAREAPPNSDDLPRPGRPRTADTRAIAQACLFRYFHSLAPAYHTFGWNELPKKLGVSPATANRRFREWTESGAWIRFWHGLFAMRPSLRRPRKLEPSVSRTIAELQRAFLFFNARFFRNLLPTRTIITIERMRRPSTALGCFSYAGGFGCIAVAFRVFRRGPREVLNTLLHEMVHYRNHLVGLPDVHRRYHNHHFRDTAAVAGLDCVRRSGIGYGRTKLNKHGIAVIRAFRPRKAAFRWPVMGESRSDRI